MFYVVVLLRSDDLAGLAEFEAKALPIAREHGAELLVAFRPELDSAGAAVEDRVDEVHVLCFPDGQAFDAYRADARLQALAPLRQRVVAGTRVLASGRPLDY